MELSTTLKRIVSGSIFGIIALSILLFSQKWIALSFLFLLFLIAIFEYSLVSTKKKVSILFIALLVFFMIRGYDFFSLYTDSGQIHLWLNQQFFIVLVLALLGIVFIKSRYQQASLFLLGGAFIILPFFFIASIFQFADFKKLIIFLCFVTIFNDTFAYFIGKKWGNKKIFPKTSPKKTYFGSFAGIFFSVLIAIVLEHFFQLFGYAKAVLLGVSLSISAQAGDWLASRFKRFKDIKDYGKFLMGHGGMLDRLDSLLLSSILYYYAIFFFL